MKQDQVASVSWHWTSSSVGQDELVLVDPPCGPGAFSPPRALLLWEGDVDS